MISWIKGEVLDSWQIGNKFFILINCQDLGYEIQILETLFIKLKKRQKSDVNIILWLKHLKKEDSDLLFGFVSKDQKQFFIEILNIKGVGAQIGMSLLNKFSVNEIINAIHQKDKKLISSVPGIGKKMTERLFLELDNNLSLNFNNFIEPKNNNLIDTSIEIKSLLQDIDMTLQSLNYPKKEIQSIFPIIMRDLKSNQKHTKNENKITFENLLKIAMNHLDKNSSNFGL